MSHRTLYELVVKDGDARFLIAYCSSRSRRMILEVCQKHGKRLETLTGSSEIHFAKTASEGATLGNWKIVFSGRTRLDAKPDPLTWIGECPESRPDVCTREAA